MGDVAHIHYLPHHAVVCSDRDTTKLRIVHDASAKPEDKASQNDCLLIGQKFNHKILDILLRFRTHQIGLRADVKKDFLMISVKDRDQDVLRFLWVNDKRMRMKLRFNH